MVRKIYQFQIKMKHASVNQRKKNEQILCERKILPTINNFTDKKAETNKFENQKNKKKKYKKLSLCVPEHNSPFPILINSTHFRPFGT